MKKRPMVGRFVVVRGAGLEPSFRRPEKTSLKTSFQEFVSLRHVTGIFCHGLTHAVRESAVATPHVWRIAMRAGAPVLRHATGMSHARLLGFGFKSSPASKAKSRPDVDFLRWCAERDLNPHALWARHFKCLLYTNSNIRATFCQ